MITIGRPKTKLFLTKSTPTWLNQPLGQDGIFIYKRTSHPSNIRTWTPRGFLPIHLDRPRVDHFWVFKTNSNVKSTKKHLTFEITNYLKTFTLDETEVHSYTSLHSLQDWGPTHPIWSRLDQSNIFDTISITKHNSMRFPPCPRMNLCRHHESLALSQHLGRKVLLSPLGKW